MNISKKWFLLALAALVAGRILLMALNVVVDPYGIFRTNLFRYATVNDFRYTKIQHLKEINFPYGTYILGSSKAAFIDPREIKGYMPAGGCYNLSIQSADINDYVLFSRYLLSSAKGVENIFLFLDIEFFTSFQEGPFGENGYQYEPHYDIADVSPYRFYWHYLSSVQLEAMTGKLYMNLLRNRKKIFYDASNTGMFFFYNYDNGESDSKANRMVFDCVGAALNMNRPEVALSALENLLRFYGSRNIKVTVVLNPTHHKFRYFITEQEYNYLIRTLSKVTSFWNFSNKNSINVDENNYYDGLHFKPHVGRMMIARIFNSASVRVPSDFGYYVQKEGSSNP